MEPSVCIVLFTKPAVPGRVKTRMQAEGEDGRIRLSAEDAARLHLAFLRDVLDRLGEFAAAHPAGRVAVEIAWAVDGAGDADAPGAIEAFEEEWGDWRDPDFIRRAPIASARQVGGDLGERLWRGLSSVAQRHDVVIAVGSDHPELQPAQLERAVGSCWSSTARATFVPADDGGFVLVALRSKSLTPSLFENIDWSTAAVMQQCRDRAEAEGLEVVELETAHDCDDPGALQALAGRLAVVPGRCPHTEAVLRRTGLLERAS